MKTARSLGSGLVGACVLTLIHESVRRSDPDAPRMDKLGVEALAKLISRVGMTPPPEEKLHTAALLGDIASNTLYYSVVGDGDDAQVWWRGAGLGLSAGLGALLTPPKVGLNSKAAARTTKTKIMTVLWYLAGGLAAAAASRLFSVAAARR